MAKPRHMTGRRWAKDTPLMSRQQTHPTTHARTASRPLIGLTADADGEKFLMSNSYVHSVSQAGGLPIILPCVPDLAREFAAQCDAIMLTGGDDPITTRWGVPL